MWHDKIQISRKCGKPVSKTRQDEQRQCGYRSGVINTQIFFRPAHPPVSQKMSLVNFKHKITNSANYMEGIGIVNTSNDKEICLHSKINQSN